MTSEEYTEVLNSKLEALMYEISNKRERIQGLFAEIDTLEKQANNIIELLNIEGISNDLERIPSLGSGRISDTAYKFLTKSKDKTPTHYKELANQIMASGVGIPGKDPAANLLTHLNRDNRFVRVAPGTYGLEEWGLTPMAKKKKRRKKTTRKKS